MIGEPSLSRLTGVDIAVTPKAGLSLAMVFHELASNAAKYWRIVDGRRGACSVVDGETHISRCCTSSGSRRRTSYCGAALKARIRFNIDRANPLS